MYENAKVEHDEAWKSKGHLIDRGRDRVIAYTNLRAFNERINQMHHQQITDDLKDTERVSNAFEKNLLPLNDDGNHVWGDGVTAFKLGYFLRPRVQDLCNGKQVRPPHLDAKVQCHFVHHDNPFLKLGPFKIEIMHHQPQVVIIHDFISLEECEWIKEGARGRMSSTPFTIVNKGNAKTDAYSKGRTSKVMYMSESKTEHRDVITKISDRISQATRFDVYKQRFASENYQVMNYGVGGNINGHVDSLGHRKGSSESNIIGGLRFVTFMMYLSDVGAGGHTVFPQIGVSVKPEAGKAVFWFNLHSNGDFDTRNFHLGCPVIHGNKWIANKWVKWSAQMFKNYPCKPNCNQSHYSII